MAETADRKLNPFEDEHDEGAPVPTADAADPLMALSQIVGAGDTPPAPTETAETMALDLEQALTAELAIGDTVETVQPVAENQSTQAEPALPELTLPENADIASDQTHGQLEETQVEQGPMEPAQAEPVIVSEPEPQLAKVEDVPSLSLEDELAAMLGQGPSAPQPESEQIAPVDTAQTTQVADIAEPVEPSFEPPVADAPITEEAAPALASEPIAEPTEPLVVDHANVEPLTADDDLQQAGPDLESELAMAIQSDAPADADASPVANAPEPTTLDPVDELAAIMGLDRAEEPQAPERDADLSLAPQASEEPPLVPDLSALDAEFESALARDLPDLVEEQQGEQAAISEPEETRPAAGAPVLDTVDMSNFDDVEPTAFSVPQFDESTTPSPQTDAFADLEDELAGMFSDEEPGAGATSAAAAAGIAAATVPPMTDQIADFDAQQFEAELARDMEFVNHDLDAARTDADDSAVDDEAPSGDTEAGAEPAKKSRRGAMIGLVVGGLAVAGIAAVLSLAGQRDVADEGPVLVEADAEPVKIAPEDPGGTTVPNQDRAVFAESNDAAPAQETLVSTTEEPLDIATAPDDTLPSVVATGEKVEDRLTAGGTESTAEEPVATITPRRVRTLIVRPDGTLEERATEEPVAPIETVAAQTTVDAGSGVAESGVQAATEAVAAAPTVPNPVEPEAVVEQAQAVVSAPEEPVVVVDQTEATVTTTGTTEPVTATATETAANAVPATTTQGTESAAASGTEAATQSAEAPVVVRRVQTTSATPPIIRDRPADQPVNVINRTQTQQVASVETTPAAPAPVTTTTQSSGFTVQLAALPSEAAARDTASRLSQQYGSLIGSRGITIQRAEVEGRGTFYRVRVAAEGSGDATGLCNQIKASGGNCFVAR